MLLYAADELMKTNPRLGEVTGGGGPYFMKAEGSEPAFVTTATPFRGTASVAEIQGILRAVQERLSPPGGGDPAHPTLKLELWWVEGVHEKTPELELPSPLILDEVLGCAVVCGGLRECRGECRRSRHGAAPLGG